VQLLIADDHKLVLEALAAYLKKLAPDVEITQAPSFGNAFDILGDDGAFDLVILDLHMPGMNGLEGLQRLKAKFPTLPTVVISGQATNEQAREALNKGASGFLPKDVSGEAMLKALELVLAGEVYVPSMALTMEGTASGKYDFDQENPMSELTMRELEFLCLLTQGCSNKEIADSLGLKYVTIAYHLKNIYRKLGVKNRTGAVNKAIKLGWNI